MTLGGPRYRRPSHPAVALLGAAVGTGACGQRTLATDLEPAEAQRCAIVLRAAGLDVAVERDAGGSGDRQQLAVRGDEADYRSALEVLEEHSLPHRRVAGFSADGSSLVPSPTEERARFIKGLSGEIERMLESIDGVVSAEVLVSLPERRPLTPVTDEASASAVVAHTGDTPPVDADEVRSIVVRAAGSSLSADHVAVVLKPVARQGATRPVVRYERDRATEAGFLVAVAGLSTALAAAVWRLRAIRVSNAKVSDE
jgi:type III secretion protein J